MRKYFFIKQAFNLLVFLICVSCEDTFIPDPFDPRLPKYTEEGRGAAGAFINDEIWKSIENHGFMSLDHKSKIYLYADKDSMSLVFRGESEVFNYLRFDLSNMNINQFSDLSLLEGRKIQLDGITNGAFCLVSGEGIIFPYMDTKVHLKNVCSGQLLIRKAKVYNSNEAILSGTFGFITDDPVYGRIEVFYGRFDFQYGENENFLSL